MSESQYYLVVDLEATCDDGGRVPRHQSEIIEIGAVRVDARSLQVVDEFQTFVRPVRHRQLTPFCTQLTTITQADVDRAPPFRVAAARLAAYGAGARFCSWGDYDRHQLAADAAYHRIPAPLRGPHWNLKQSFADAFGLARGIGTYAALARCHLKPIGTHHRAIDDARNIARLLAEIIRARREAA